MFNVVIEKESHNKIDPLIITEDINLIVQSIEEQLYNINVSYRNNVRKIKNDLKLLTGVSESNLVILEDSDITNDNLISYLTNVLEISLVCVVSTLYEDNDYRNKLSSVNSLNDLLAIDHCNTPVLKNIVDHSNELFSVYSESNDIQPSTTTFYELLDSAIIKSIKNNQSTVVPTLTEEEVIYQKVIENLDKLIDVDLTVTYDNIKSFTHSQVNENIITAIGGFFRVLSLYFRSWKNTGIGILTVGVGLAGITVIGYIRKMLDLVFTPKVEDFDFDNTNGANVKNTLKMLEGMTNKDNALGKLDSNKLQALYNYAMDENTPPEESILIKTILHNVDVTPSNLFDKLQTEWKPQIDQARATLEDLKTQAGNLEAKIKSGGTELANIYADELNKVKEQFASKTKELNDLIEQNKLQSQANEMLVNLAKKLNDKIADLQIKVDEADEFLKNLGFYSAGIVGVAAIIYMVFAHYIGKRIFLTSNSADTIHAILALRKKIDVLRKDTLSLFPDLKIQFDQLDNEIIKCERDSTRQNDVIMAYQCSMKYFMGSYAIILFSVFSQLVKDGNNLNNFNTLASVHNFDGFASLKTRMMVKELNSFYTLMIDYDKTMIDSFEKIFYLVKQEILQNKSLSDITKRLPNQLALGKN